MIHLAIFASGKGTNAEAIINYFRNSRDVAVGLVVSSHPDAGVIEVAKKNRIPVAVVTKENLYDSQELLEVLSRHEISFIVLAGFLWYVPAYVLENYPNRIINIHPALLPRHGGKGMYGRKVHEAVLNAKETETGITVHYVNERYDEGEIIFQKKCSVEPDDDATTLEAKVQRLEHEYYPKVIEKILLQEPVRL
ncbi:MAG TPA: phosphoribosylglycinamide formyltransferase [Chitinophagales bacterium]|nr:phosphoribosylglycinamide formyltransferase [Chitinophagales bacterium]